MVSRCISFSFLISPIIAVLPHLGFSQDHSSIGPKDDWEKVPIGDGSGHTKGDLAFYKRSVSCGEQKGVLLRVVNKGEKELELTARHAFLLDGGWYKRKKLHVRVPSSFSTKRGLQWPKKTLGSLPF